VVDLVNDAGVAGVCGKVKVGMKEKGTGKGKVGMKGKAKGVREKARARRKERFLKVFLETGMISHAWGVVGRFGRGLIYKWLKKDAEFAARFERAKEEVRGRVKLRKKGVMGRRLERARWKRKELFLKEFMRRGTVCRAARAVGMRDHSPVYKWLKKDAGFAEGFAWVKEELRKDVKASTKGRKGKGVLMYYGGEPIFMRRGVRSGEEREWSDRLLMLRLKALKPEMYGGRGTA
jgi:hypothetical protein